MDLIRVLLAEDHGLVRAGMRALLENILGVQVVAEADDGQSALHLIDIYRPDVVLLDIRMPKLNGLEVAAQATRQLPSVRIIILSMYSNEEYVLHALRAGVMGYLLKDASIDELELAIRSVASGRPYLSPAVLQQAAPGSVQPYGGQDAPVGTLTLRQREILQLIAEGHTTQKIAQTLNRSVKTIETHRAQLMQRLGIHDIAGLVRYAIRVGLVEPQ